jgi:hypothetical protein
MSKRANGIENFATMIATGVMGAVITGIYSEFDKIVVPRYEVSIQEPWFFKITLIIDDFKVASQTLDVMYGFSKEPLKKMDQAVDEFAGEIMRRYRAYIKEKNNES